MRCSAVADGTQTAPVVAPTPFTGRRNAVKRSIKPLGVTEEDEHEVEQRKVERLQQSLKAFYKSSQPGDEAFTAGAVERADDLILSLECEQLLSSADDVMRAAGQPQTGCLRRIPRAVARKSLALACTALAPDLVERDRLKAKAGELLAQLLGNTKAYLEELAPLRSRIRNIDERKFTQAAADVYKMEIPAAVYHWDPLLALPEHIQMLAIGVILEKLRCLITQSPLTTMAELTAWNKKMQARILTLEAAKSSTEEELVECRKRRVELDRNLAAQTTRNRELEKECHQAKFLRKQVEGAREEAQRERERADAMEAELKQMQKKLASAHDSLKLEEDLDKQRASNQKLEKMLVDFRHAEAVRQQQARSCAERLCSQNWRRSIEESDARHLSEVMRRGVTDIITSSLEEKDSGTWLQTVTERATSLCYQLEVSRDRETSHRARAEEKLESASSHIQRLEMDLGQTRMVNSVTEDRCQQLELELSQSAYKELHDRFEEYVQAHCTNKERLEELEAEAAALRAELALVKQELEEAESELAMRRETMEQMRRALEDAEAHVYHPARVAELRAELRHAQHEAQAALNANAALRGALDIVRSKLASSVAGRRAGVHEEEIRYLLDTCNRSVYERLYEDAMRRQTREFTFFRGERAASPPPAGASRSRSPPVPTALPCRMVSRDAVPADIEERTFDGGRRLRAAQLRNMHFLESTVDDFPLRTHSLMSRSRSEPTMLPDLVNLRKLLVETVKDKTGRMEQPLITDHMPLTERFVKGSRRSPSWKGSNSSPTPTHSRSPSRLHGRPGDDASVRSSPLGREPSPSIDERLDVFQNFPARRCGSAGTKDDPYEVSSCPPTATPTSEFTSPHGRSSGVPQSISSLCSPDLRWGGAASPPFLCEDVPEVPVGGRADAAGSGEPRPPPQHHLWPADSAPETPEPLTLLPAMRPTLESARPKQLAGTSARKGEVGGAGADTDVGVADEPEHENSSCEMPPIGSGYAPMGILPSSRPKSAVAKAARSFRGDVGDVGLPPRPATSMGVASTGAAHALEGDPATSARFPVPPHSAATAAEGIAALRALVSPNGVRSFVRGTFDRGKANVGLVPVDAAGAGGKTLPFSGRSSRKQNKSWTPRTRSPR